MTQEQVQLFVKVQEDQQKLQELSNRIEIVFRSTGQITLTPAEAEYLFQLAYKALVLQTENI